jgi:lipase chaperone LimK
MSVNRNKNKAIATAVLLAGSIVVVASGVWLRGEAQQIRQADSGTAQPMSEALGPSRARGALAWFVQPLVHRRDTVWESLSADSDGQLVINHETRMAIENLLARLKGDTRPEELRSLQAGIHEGPLPETAARQLADLVGRYHAYQPVANEVQDNHVLQAEGLEAVESLLALTRRTETQRREHFGPADADGLFGYEEAHTRYTLEMMRLEEDKTLTVAQRAARAAEIEASLMTKFASGEADEADL